MILRNLQNKVVFAECKAENIVADNVLAEALGIRWCLLKVKELDLAQMIIYSNAAVVVDCINQRSSRASIDHIAQDCRELLQQIPGSSIQHIRRSLNSDAHCPVCLARDITWSNYEQLCSLVPRCNFSFNCNDFDSS